MRAEPIEVGFNASVRAPEVKIKSEPLNYNLNFSAPEPKVRANADFGFKADVRAPRVEVRAEPIRANADFGFRAEVKAPRVKLQTCPVSFKVKVDAPDLRMKCFHCGDHNLKLVSALELNRLKNLALKTSAKASISVPKV